MLIYACPSCRTKNMCVGATTTRGWKPSSRGCLASSPKPLQCSTQTTPMTPYCSVMLSVSFCERATLPGAGAEHRGRTGYGQNQTLSAGDSNWFIVGCGVGEWSLFIRGVIQVMFHVEGKGLCLVISTFNALPTALASHTVCVLRSIPDTFSWPVFYWEQILVPEHYFPFSLLFFTSVFYFFTISLSLKLLNLFIPKALNLIILIGHLYWDLVHPVQCSVHLKTETHHV